MQIPTQKDCTKYDIIQGICQLSITKKQQHFITKAELLGNGRQPQRNQNRMDLRGMKFDPYKSKQSVNFMPPRQNK